MEVAVPAQHPEGEVRAAGSFCTLPLAILCGGQRDRHGHVQAQREKGLPGDLVLKAALGYLGACWHVRVVDDDVAQQAAVRFDLEHAILAPPGAVQPPPVESGPVQLALVVVPAEERHRVPHVRLRVRPRAVPPSGVGHEVRVDLKGHDDRPALHERALRGLVVRGHLDAPDVGGQEEPVLLQVPRVALRGGAVRGALGTLHVIRGVRVLERTS
mmetsp:Transcript_23721/g.68479  ORF Transcript_23721/g.68479 Transcript_23721/m.68479 type:complete len:214 (-) Transcript_23721:98-739(-)